VATGPPFPFYRTRVKAFLSSFFSLFFPHLLKLPTMTLQERLKAPTPLFFKKVRKTGLVLAAVGSSVLLAPVALPAVVKLVAGYLVPPWPCRRW
jgi:hypothetical protein